MNLRSILCHFFIILCFSATYSQKESRKWYFGYNAGLDFCSNPPTVLTNGALQTLEGCSSISDPSGNLLFYSNGQTIWDKTHAVMANGTGLLSSFSTSQACLIVKQPGSSTIYYVFSLFAYGHPNGLNYSIVDMSLAGGNGSVTVKNVVVQDPSAEKLAGVMHDNGSDVWIISHDVNTNDFRANLLTSAGLNTTAVISSVGLLISWGDPTIGYMKVSPDRKRIAMAVYNLSRFELFDFNASNGQVSNPLSLSSPSMAAYGCEFSPDSKKLYGTSWHDTDIHQWNLNAGSNSAIVQSKTSVYTSTVVGFGALQLGPNGKIYVARPGRQTLGVIHSPNTIGINCNYADVGQSLGTATCQFGLPNYVNPGPVQSDITLNGPNAMCMGETSILSISGASTYSWNGGIFTQSITISPTTLTNYSVTGTSPAGTGCNYSIVATVDVLSCTGISDFNKNDDFELYPNPVVNTLKIKNHHKESHFTIFDSFGRQVKIGTLNYDPTAEINVGDLKEGIYYLSFEGDYKKFVITK